MNVTATSKALGVFRVQPIVVTVSAGAPVDQAVDVRCTCGESYAAPIRDGLYMCPRDCGVGVRLEAI